MRILCFRNGECFVAMPHLDDEHIAAPPGWAIVGAPPNEVVDAIAIMTVSQQSIGAAMVAAIDDKIEMNDPKARRVCDRILTRLLIAFECIDQARGAADSDGMNPAQVIRVLKEAQKQIARSSQTLMLAKRVGASEP